MRRYRFTRLALIGLLAFLLGIEALPSTTTLAQAAPVYYAPNQVIVTGREGAIRDVLAVAGLALTRLERASLGYTTGLPSAAPFPFPPPRADLVMDLYRIDDGTAVPLAIDTINAAVAATGKLVRSDPNYATGRPPATVSADPWSVEGSPAGAELFHQQWAFDTRGIGLYRTSVGALTRSVPFTGDGVRIGIFDTSPFTVETDTMTTSLAIAWADPPLALEVAHPHFTTRWPPPSKPTDVRDHGLFAAGLAHAVAPQSDIMLTRVLNDDGQGDLYTLSRELHRFISDTIELDASITGSVINLSLGVHPPPDAAALGLPAEIAALATAMLAADGFGIVVVAAAGNDGNVDAMQLPASYPKVIGVAASSAQRGRGCFSNRGDIGAPGGDGRASDCLPAIERCTDDCAAGVISLAMIHDPSRDTGYLYWSGTSFAAPLASGAAALAIEQHKGAATPAQVAVQLYTSALPPNLPRSDDTLGAGIINLKQMLLP
ncbi:MAG TPA: S8 family serine peptidase, partial [Roseiflexaceae bacterium]|nr:S8 family serine peptidase [Roseiflexaceae bacterium]